SATGEKPVWSAASGVSTSNSTRWRNRPAAGSECWSASTTFPPVSATYAPTAATMPGRSAHCKRRAARMVGRSEQREIGVDVAAQPRQVDLHARDTLALRVHPGLGLDVLRDEHAGGRRELRVAVEAFLVPQQLVDARDLGDALHLHHDRAALTVAAQQVDGTDVGWVLAPDEHEVV